MASHAQNTSDPVSVAKLGLYGTIGTAVIGLITAIVVPMFSADNGSADTPAAAAAPTTSAPPVNPKSDYVSFNKMKMEANGGVTVSGITDRDVNATGVVVSIGPKPDGEYWSGFGNLSNQQWQADVKTDPPWQNYEITAAYYYGNLGSAAPAPAVPASPEPKVTTEPARPAVAPAGRLVSDNTIQSALMLAFQPPPTTSPAPPPDELMHCVEQFGPKCFNGPEFGPSSVYAPTS